MEATAKDAIRKEVQKVMDSAAGPVIAISGGASGGDLLFMEVCEEMNVERQLFLIMPRAQYVAAHVEFSGGDWAARFDRQHDTAKVRVFQRSEEKPRGWTTKRSTGFGSAPMFWMIENALWHGPQNTTLLALWDGVGGEGPGGSKHMVDSLRGRGARYVHLDTKELFALV